MIGKQKLGSTPRTRKLKERALNIKPAICCERASIFTEVFKQTENEPQIIRRAKGFKKVLEEMSIFIGEDELLVGNVVSSPRGAPVFPEVAANWLDKELNTFETRRIDKFKISNETKKVIRGVIHYWKNKTIEDRVRSIMPEETLNLVDFEYPVVSPQNMINNMIGHLILDYNKTLKLGFKAIQSNVNQKLKELELTNPENIQKKQFYRAELIVCDGAINYIKRYARKAAQFSKKELNEKRKDELKKIAHICEWISINPPRNFYEAIQLYLFVHILGHFETDAQAISTGRFDFLLYPYFEKDIKRNILKKEDALELLECFWIKNFEMNHLFDKECSTYFGGYAIVENMILGGKTEDGKSSVNELSYLCLEAEDRMKLTQPAIAVRISENTPYKFKKKACEVVRRGGGKPSFFNDKIIIPQLLSENIPLKKARNYAIVGCVEPTSVGDTYGWTNAAMFNLAKCLELALNDGVCRLNNKQYGIHSGNPTNFTSFSEVMKAFREQVAYFVKHMVIALNTIDLVHAELCPLPFLSLMIDNCIEKGQDISKGGARYNYTGPQGVGLADVADSLAAIKKLVFEENRIKMRDLIKALNKNFEGRWSSLRELLISQAPKYGNDEDYVDFVAKEVASIYCEEVEKYKNPRGGKYRPGLYPVSANVPLGERVGALPNGRKAKTPLADGISPTHGSDKNGPTAVLKSVAKIEHIKATNGTQLNQLLSPSILEGSKGLKSFINLIESYFELQGLHVQFNVVSIDTLKYAKLHPEHFKTLLVRVAGYSAYFVELDDSIQDDIIKRTEQTRF